MAKRQTKDQKALATARKSAAAARAGRKKDAESNKKKLTALRKKLREMNSATKVEDLAINAAGGAAGGAAVAVVAKMATDRVSETLRANAAQGMTAEQLAANGSISDKIAVHMSDPRKAGLAVGVLAGGGAVLLSKSKGKGKGKAMAVRGLQALSGGGLAIAAHAAVNRAYRPVEGYRQSRRQRIARRPAQRMAQRPMARRPVTRVAPAPAIGGNNR